MQQVFWTQRAKRLLHRCNPILHRCKRGFGWRKRLLGDFCSLGPKDLLHPLLTNFGDFLFSGNFPGPWLPNCSRFWRWMLLVSRLFTHDSHDLKADVANLAVKSNKEVISTPDLDILKSIAIHLSFLSPYFCKSMPSFWQKVAKAPPICVTIRLPFVSKYFCRRIRVRGRLDTPKQNGGLACLATPQCQHPHLKKDRKRPQSKKPLKTLPLRDPLRRRFQRPSSLSEALGPVAPDRVAP